MIRVDRRAGAALATLLVAGCGGDGLWPDRDADQQRATATPAEVLQIPPPTNAGSSGSTEVVLATTRVPLGDAAGAGAASAAAPSTTFVGQTVQSLRAELTALSGSIAAQRSEYQGLRDQAAAASQRYHGIVGEINARLQVGTTPGNPIAVAQWQSAQNELDSVASQSSRLTQLSNRIAANVDLANFLVKSTAAAYRVQGAVEEDHRQLAIVEDDLNKLLVVNDRLLEDINGTIGRHNSYLAGERGRLTELAVAIGNGRFYGPDLASATAPLAPIAARGGGHRGTPLVVIRFDSPDIAFEDPLYDAMRRALDGRPDARFELVAVTPVGGAPSDIAANTRVTKRYSERVLRALVDMGLPADRVMMSSETSEAVRTNEVQIFLQ